MLFQNAIQFILYELTELLRKGILIVLQKIFQRTE
jgi:hypothetical protein